MHFQRSSRRFGDLNCLLQPYNSNARNITDAKLAIENILENKIEISYMCKEQPKKEIKHSHQIMQTYFVFVFFFFTNSHWKFVSQKNLTKIQLKCIHISCIFRACRVRLLDEYTWWSCLGTMHSIKCCTVIQEQCSVC